MIEFCKNEYSIKNEFGDNKSFIDYLKNSISLTNTSLNVLKKDVESSISVDKFNSVCKDLFERVFIIEIARYLSANKYLEVLALKKNQLSYTDEYGDLREDDWYNELARFIERKKDDMLLAYVSSIKSEQKDIVKKIDPFIGAFKMKNFLYPCIVMPNKQNENYQQRLIINSLETIVDNYLYYKKYAKFSEVGGSFAAESPYDYEKRVADLLIYYGWNAKVTQKTNDQGADIVATRDNIKMVVQCKMYNAPVGNSAVQEVIAAMRYYEADLAAVVASSSFTKSARQLAQSAEVVLLHESQIENFSLEFDSKMKYAFQNNG